MIKEKRNTMNLMKKLCDDWKTYWAFLWWQLLMNSRAMMKDVSI
jgi:hypothetical protein